MSKKLLLVWKFVKRAFLLDKYEEEMQNRTATNLDKAIEIKNRILSEYLDILEHPKKKHYLEILTTINENTIYAIDFRRPSWSATDRFAELSQLFKDLKDNIKIVQKRDYLSITPKVEDLKVVYKWVENFNVPHYYLQVFFDKSYGVSFNDILLFLGDPQKEGEYYEISKDVKNQNKTTIKINTRKTTQVAYKVKEPEHNSVRREMGRGRLLFYVTFEKGTAYLDVDNLKRLLNIEEF
ncbi:MAG: AccI family restriction endonuclease [Gomphosphaeria aponina SAG 52.96 = DSM 107014]|uniref:AccI family restriction endonuclease n=1 Tax=Gomphosphaeria aponina SAG 52.96 = DSM 107014 TaxID=1521640 RepID=A0A941GVM2_9CHRO|nr:AccI family restriction endonuclease [Gomphosphaeria aponina SAG 52.96 = DSM 107014]